MLAEYWEDWLIAEVEGLTEKIDRVLPSVHAEKYRRLSSAVTSLPGPMSYETTPYLREIVDCVAIESDVREVNVMKGVQVGYTTGVLETAVFYFATWIKTVPLMFMSADKDLAKSRLEDFILLMLKDSGFSGIIRSSDTTNKRKTGQTAAHIQWEGGGSLIPFGAKNADKMRTFSILGMLKDEVDAWPERVGKDGDPDKLSDGRCKGYWETRKIVRGSTPLLKESSIIYRNFLRGDQRRYYVRCVSCGFAQPLRWHGKRDDGKVYGMAWELDNRGILVLDSVRYLCANCGHAHQNHDKPRLFDPAHGAEWRPTETAREPGIRSYHLPALYSPVGMTPWSACVADFLEAYDPVTNRVLDFNKFQTYYNNVLGEPFAQIGGRVRFAQVSGHRRAAYRLGEIPDAWAMAHCESSIKFLTCTVDVHKDKLAVAVWGWTVGARCFLIDYWHFKGEDCTQNDSPVWNELRDLIEKKEYAGGRQIMITLIDAGFEQDLVTGFCAEYAGGVFPILGRDRAAKNQAIKEFAEFKTQSGVVGFRILVDHYKDRMAAILRRDWAESMGDQVDWTFNAPVDLPDAALRELTTEYRRQKRDARGAITHEWYRPAGSSNELWDLCVYGCASVEILAWQVSVQFLKLDRVDWDRFWKYFD
jgi:phage terminase large subunit GpA-like protein